MWQKAFLDLLLGGEMVEPIFIDGKELSDNCPPYIIAEISANHNGSLERALDTILAAKESGADAVKIQSYTTYSFIILHILVTLKLTIDSRKNRLVQYKKRNSPSNAISSQGKTFIRSLIFLAQ